MTAYPVTAMTSKKTSKKTSKNNTKVLRVNALWDDEAGVWSASSTDLAGLALEAATTEALIKRLEVVIPELLKLNHANPEQTTPVELIISGRQSLALACQLILAPTSFTPDVKRILKSEAFTVRAEATMKYGTARLPAEKSPWITRFCHAIPPTKH